MAELHFKEGFEGDAVEVRVEGALVSTFDARTRMQSGLARVLPLEARPGQLVTIAMPRSGATSTFRVEAPYGRIDVEGGRLKVQQSQEVPRSGRPARPRIPRCSR